MELDIFLVKLLFNNKLRIFFYAIIHSSFFLFFLFFKTFYLLSTSIFCGPFILILLHVFLVLVSLLISIALVSIHHLLTQLSFIFPCLSFSLHHSQLFLQSSEKLFSILLSFHILLYVLVLLFTSYSH